MFVIGNLEIMELLFQHGTLINSKDNYCRTPIHYAASYGNLEVMKLLLLNGADIDCKDKNGRTSLHLAVEDGQFEIVKILVEKGAKINCKDNQYITPLNLAKGHKQIAEYLMKTSTKLLISECEKKFNVKK